MAEAFGREILAGLDIVGFDEITNSIRHNEQDQSQAWFSCTHIDGILRNLGRGSSETPPMIEITSVAPQGGKTHTLYHLTAAAVLPKTYGGREACVVILDTDNSFDVSRLLQQINLRLNVRTADQTEAGIIAQDSLDHIYVFKPKDRITLISTIASLPEWAFSQKHKSLDRPMAFFAIDSITALSWSMATTAAKEEIALLKTTLRSSSKALNTAIIITASYQGRLPKTHDDAMPRSLRPEAYSPAMSTVRLIVRRVPVRNIPSSLDEEQKARETAERMKIVALGRFECVVNLHGLSPHELQKLRESGDGFYFRITSDGLIWETEDEDVAR